MMQLEHTSAFVVERRIGGGGRMQPVDAREQTGIHLDRRPMPRRQGRDPALDLLQRRAGMGRRQMPEDGADPLQQPARILQRVDRIGEIRRGGIGGDARDLGVVGVEPGLEGRQEMRRRDAIERRQAEGAGPGLEQRIVVADLRGAGVGHALRPPRS